ncbi:hypothetical protein AB3464_03125 [Pseudomonas asplenii]|uniref:hypothetical protein n=1 Tax=Pseudomonas asplenii TaxID=53407 RepID=UPI0037CB69E7
MSDDFLSYHDLDWFASNSEGFVFHFSTGGRGSVLLEVRSSLYNYEALYEYFESLPESFDAEVVGSRHSRFNDDGQRERYLKSFVAMAKKGLFSYDADLDGEVGDSGGYVLIVKPDIGIRYLDLPDSIKDMICILPLKISMYLGRDIF